MSISIIQAIILGLFASLSSMPGMGSSSIGNYTLGRPLVGGLVCGIPLAMLAIKAQGLDPASDQGMALATSFGAMVGTVGTVLFYGTATLNLVWQHIGWKAIENRNYKQIFLVDRVYPWISHLAFSMIPTVIMCMLGAPVVDAIKTHLPMDGLAMKTLFTVGSLLPCVGIAILLKQIVRNVTDFIPYLTGFVFARSIGINLVSATVVAGMFAILVYRLKLIQVSRPAAAAGAGGGAYDDDEEEDI